MCIFDRLSLNAFARYDEGLQLPDEMAIGEIAILWATKPGDQRKGVGNDDAVIRRLKIMRQAFKDGGLKGVDVCSKELAEIAADSARGDVGLVPFGDSNRIRIMRESGLDIRISKANFLNWLRSESTPRPSRCQLESWFQEDMIDGKLKDLTKEDGDRATVRDIGQALLKKYPDDWMRENYGDVFTTTDARKVEGLKRFYLDYPGKDPVKPDGWLESIGMKRGPRGRQSKLKMEFFPNPDDQ